MTTTTMDKPIFRMSESGKCVRALSAKLLGYEPTPAPSWLEQAANEGNWHEKRIKDQLLEDGYFVHGEQEEVTLDLPAFQLIGHIDGMVTKDGVWSAYKSHKPMPPSKLLEIKSMSQFEFDRWMRGRFAAFPQYEAQLACYLMATELSEALYIVKNRSSGYEDRRSYYLSSFIITYQYTIAQLEKVAKATELLEADFDPQSIECRRCEYKHLCVPEAKELTPVEKADLDSATEEWRKGKALVEKGQALIGIAKEAFEQHTRATNILKWQHSGLAIQLVHYSEQKTYPKSKLYQHFTEEQLEVACQIKEAYDTLRISDLTKENDNA